MNARGKAGFTIVELMVAVLVLGVGITALVGSSALVTRQIGRGRMMTLANEVATRRLERLRLDARPHAGATTPCSGLAGGGPVTTRGVTESWTVSGSGTTRTVTVTVSYPVKGGTASSTLRTVIGCY